MFDIIFFAILAVFIISRLFKVLGDTSYDRELNNEEREFYENLHNQLSKENLAEAKEIIQQINIASALEASLPQEYRDVFDKIREYDSTFSAENFIKGAEYAYELIINAFAKGDRQTLQELLSDEIYQDFIKEIEKRASSTLSVNITVVGIKKCEIVDVFVEEDIANIVVKVVSDQIRFTKDEVSGEVINGNKNNIMAVTELWSFSKEIKSITNMWKLSATDVEE
jgi:predicted lipid-binding transport protein (Tim44 family)